MRATVATTAGRQRAPVFMFDNALQAREFACGSPSTDESPFRRQSTTSIELIEIEQYAVGPLRYLRFRLHHRDAAGQNMVGRATWAAWGMDSRIIRLPRITCSGAIDTDKHSQINVAQPAVNACGRGRRSCQPPCSSRRWA